jgi:thioredoxin-like negative regulator of GroEL
MSIELTTFDELPADDLDILVEALESLEKNGVQAGISMGDFFSGMIAAEDADEAKAILKTRSEDARNGIRAKKRRVALLKAALIQKQIDREAVTFFVPRTS